MSHEDDPPFAQPLSYESADSPRRPAGGAIIVLIAGFILLLVGGAIGLLAISVTRRAPGEAVVAMTFAAGLIGVIGLVLIVAAARKLLS